jgi:hypothetical protein
MTLRAALRAALTSDLVPGELEKLRYYAQNRVEVGTREKARKLNLLADFERNTTWASATPLQNQSLRPQPAALHQGMPTREEHPRDARSVSAWFWVLIAVLALMLLGILLH